MILADVAAVAAGRNEVLLVPCVAGQLSSTVVSCGRLAVWGAGAARRQPRRRPLTAAMRRASRQAANRLVKVTQRDASTESTRNKRPLSA
eukprot:366315-Chlamydomonas_euryale.AAC.6